MKNFLYTVEAFICVSKLILNKLVLWHFYAIEVVHKGIRSVKVIPQWLLCVIQPLFESRMNWIHDPAPPAPLRAAMDYSDTPVQSSDTPVQSHDTHVKSRDTHMKSRDPPVLTSDTQACAIAINASSGAPLALPHPKKSRRRRRRRNRRSANENSVPRSAAPVTPNERWANRNSASQRATQHQPAASDPTQMKSTPVCKGQSIYSSHLTQPPVPATNRNSAFQFGLDRCEFPGLYKPAFPDPRQDLNTTPIRVNNSGSGFSSPSPLQPCTKPFSGRPARPQMTCPTREAGEAIRERPGIVYLLLLRAQRPDTRVAKEAALPEAVALGRQVQPPTIVDIGDTSLSQWVPSPRRRASRRPSSKRRRNRSTGVYRPPKRSPPHGTGVNRRTPPGINKIWKWPGINRIWKWPGINRIWKWPVINKIYIWLGKCSPPRYLGIDEGLQITPPPLAAHWCRTRRRHPPWNWATRYTTWSSKESDGSPLGSMLPHSPWYNTRTLGLPSSPLSSLESPGLGRLSVKDRRCPTCPGITPGL